MARREPSRFQGITRDRGMAVGGLIDEYDVEPRELRHGKRGRGDARDHDAIHLPIDERLQMLPGIHLLRLAEQDRVTLLACYSFGAGDDVRVYRIGEARHDDAKREGALMDESLREAVGPVAKLVGDGKDAR